MEKVYKKILYPVNKMHRVIGSQIQRWLIKHILVSLQLGVAMFKVIIAMEFPTVRKAFPSILKRNIGRGIGKSIQHYSKAPI